MKGGISEYTGFAKYRVFENTHILLWLIKDTCWALEFKPGGLIMIVPTVAMALYLTTKSAGNKSELLHNIAVCFWILANSIWMVGEFFEHDTRLIAAAMFCLGLTSIGVYYIFYFKKDRMERMRNIIRD